MRRAPGGDEGGGGGRKGKSGQQSGGRERGTGAGAPETLTAAFWFTQFKLSWLRVAGGCPVSQHRPGPGCLDCSPSSGSYCVTSATPAGLAVPLRKGGDSRTHSRGCFVRWVL